MNNIFNPTKLEEILIANWSAFFDARKMMNFVKNEIKTHLDLDVTVQQLVLSRFEFTNKGFLIWLEFSFPHQQNAGVLEALLTANSELLPLRVELN